MRTNTMFAHNGERGYSEGQGDQRPEEPTARTTVLIADEHTLFREGIAEICGAEPDLVVVGQASNGDDAITFARRMGPDVVLLDIEMPGPGIEDTLSGILACPDAPRVAILTTRDDARLVARLVSIGACAYISKRSTRVELLAAIRAVSRDGDHVILSLPKVTMEQMREPQTGPLSSRELEVLDLVARGLSNAQVASALYISEGTVKRHLTNVYLKLDVRSRMNAINKAMSMKPLSAHH